MMEKERAKLLMLETNAQTASAAATASEAAALAEQDKLIRSSIEEVLVSKRAKAQTCLAAKQVLVTLAGRIPLSVSMENGPIMPGDQVALSSVPGVAAKATRAGTVVGKALESFTGNTDHNKIMVFANLSYYPGNNGTVLGASTNVSLDSGTVPNGVMNYQAEALVVSGDMSVTKTLFANDIYAAGSVSTGVIQIDGVNGSIASRNGDLYVQPGDVMGNVNVFNGLLLLTPDGGIISQSDIQAHRIKAEQVVVLGAGAASASIGTGQIVKGSTTALISNALVRSTSKVFLTPTSSTGGQTLVVGNKIDGAFSVSIDRAATNDITFDYWIVGVEQ